jgi:serine/threonine protein kinase
MGEVAMSNLEGALLGEYLLIRCIAEGSAADIYHARRRGPEYYDVAIKIFHPGYAQQEAFRSHFMYKAEVLGRLDHQHILPLLEFGEGDGLLYSVTPFISTGTLLDLLRMVGGKLSIAQALPLMQQLCSALQYAHEQGVVHGNLKPSNIFIAASGRVLLTDFDVIYGYDEGQQSLLRVGWGTAEYAAPEQSLGILRPTSDIYALGVLLFHILTGVPPFTGQTPVEVLLKHVRQQAPSVRTLAPHLSEAVESVIRMAMQKRADNRFVSAAELSDAFLAAVTVAPVTSLLAGIMAPTTSQKHAHRLSAATRLLSFDTPVPPSLSPATTSVSLPQAIIDGPQTPIPASIVFDLPAPPKELPQEAPVAQAMPLQIKEPVLQQNSNEEFPAVTAADREPVLPEEKRSSSSVWSVEPPEWSPLADPSAKIATQETQKVPFTAHEYLHPLSPTTVPPSESQSPVVSVAPQPEATLPPDQDERQEDSEQTEIEQQRFKRWLPLIVVALLLLGLLGAVLSSFLLR